MLSRDAQVKGWFNLFVAKDKVASRDFHAFCNWAKGKQAPEVFNTLNGRVPFNIAR